MWNRYFLLSSTRRYIRNKMLQIQYTGTTETHIWNLVHLLNLARKSNTLKACTKRCIFIEYCMHNGILQHPQPNTTCKRQHYTYNAEPHVQQETHVHINTGTAPCIPALRLKCTFQTTGTHQKTSFDAHTTINRILTSLSSACNTACRKYNV